MVAIKLAYLFALFAFAIAGTQSNEQRQHSLRNSKRTPNVDQTMVTVYAPGNFSYFSAEWTAPSKPTLKAASQFYAGFFDAAGNFIGADISYIPGGSTDQYIYMFVDGPRYSSDYGHIVNAGDKIKSEITFLNNTWFINGYVNGNRLARYEVPLTIGQYISLDPTSEFGASNVLGTTSGNATQGYVSLFDYDYSKSLAFLFTLQNTSSGTYIQLNSNPNLVLDVSGGVAKEGARVVVYPKKNPAAANQLWTWGSDRIIYSKLSGNYSIGVNSNNQAILTKLTRSSWSLFPDYSNHYPVDSFTQNVDHAGIKFVSQLDTCNQYPSSNHANFTNIVIHKGTQLVTPAWSAHVYNSSCNLVASTTPSSVYFSWNSTSLK